MTGNALASGDLRLPRERVVDLSERCWVECRKRLPPSMRRRAGSARLLAAVVLIAFLLLRVHRNLPSAPCIKDLALRPVRLLWPLLTSPPLSRPVARAVVQCVRTTTEISSDKACLLLADPSDLPHSFRMTIGLPRPWPGDPSCKGLISASCTSNPRFRHGLSSDSASRRTPLPRPRRMVPVITVHGGLPPLEYKSY